MLVPRERLIWLSALVLGTAALVAVVEPALTLGAAVLAVAFALLAAVDALGAGRSLVGIAAEFPDVVRLTKDRDGIFDVFLKKPLGVESVVRIALDLPESFETTESEGRSGNARDAFTVRLPSDSDRVNVPWKCIGRKRGAFDVHNVYLEGTSALGLWSEYRSTPAQTEVRVYPNIQKERKQVAALFLNRGMFGAHAHRMVGKGREFEKLREYVPGDSYDEIDWKATSRRGHPVSREFQVERTQEVYVIIDTSRLSGREVLEADGVGVTTQLERFVTSAMVLGTAAERQGDLFGLVTFSNRVHRFIRAKGGKGHFTACRDALYTVETEDGNPDFEEACSFMRLRLRKRALLIFLTNLDDPLLAESFSKGIELLSRNHLVLVNMITPKGVGPLFSDDAVDSTNDVYARLSGHLRWHALQELGRGLHRRNVTLSLLHEASMTAELVTQYVTLKQRQLL